LIPILAWSGLDTDGLSSSSSGPEEAFRALGSHHYIAVLIGLANMATDFWLRRHSCLLIPVWRASLIGSERAFDA